MALSAEIQHNLASGNARWRLEFATRALLTLFSFISIIIFAVTVHQSKAVYGGNDWTDGFPIGPVSILSLNLRDICTLRRAFQPPLLQWKACFDKADSSTNSSS